MSNISFQGVYSKYRDQWYNFTDNQKEVTQEQVEKDYNSSKKKQALSVDSNSLLLNLFGDAWVETDANDLQVILTNNDVTDFKNAEKAQKKNDKNAVMHLFNKWYEGLYIFRDISVHKKDKMDILG